MTTEDVFSTGQPTSHGQRGLVRNLSIGSKLTMGFGLLVFLTLLVVGFSYFSGQEALQHINRAEDVCVPAALATSRAQANLLTMLGHVQGYLALGDEQFRHSYHESRRMFEEDLTRLHAMSETFSDKDKQRLDELQTLFEAWSPYAEHLFALRDAQREETWYQDVHVLKRDVKPIVDRMQYVLLEMTESQQRIMQHELQRGRMGLNTTHRHIFVVGFVAVLAAIILSLMLWHMIVGPIQRLTTVAKKIQAGDLSASAAVESGDEIGTFAATFNTMTAHMRENLWQLHKEKQQSDDLLQAVIPFGVTLSSEHRFNHLLEHLLLEAMSWCCADGGILYLLEDAALRIAMIRVPSYGLLLGGTSDTPVLCPPIALYDSHGRPRHEHYVVHTALSGETLTIANIHEEPTFECTDIEAFIAEYGYTIVSLCTIPLIHHHKDVLGVLQLINAQDPETKHIIPFDDNVQHTIKSFVSVAIVALEAYIHEQRVHQKVTHVRIMIDETKRQRQVSRIVDTDFFQELCVKARSLRRTKTHKHKD